MTQQLPRWHFDRIRRSAPEVRRSDALRRKSSLVPPPRALYLQVEEALRRQILTVPPNSVLPTEQQLARHFGVSRVTVRRALGVLERRGLIRRQRRSGTITSPPKIIRHFYPIYTFEQDLRQQGLKLETRVLEFEPAVTPTPEVRNLLRLPTEELVGFLSLARLVDDRIVANDRRYFPPAIARRFDPALIGDKPVSILVAELMSAAIETIDWECEILPPSSEIASVLGVTPGTLIVQSSFISYLKDNLPIETGIMCYRIDRFKFRLAGRFEDPELA